MPSKIEIYKREQNNPGKIFLYPEGMFFKAYEQSAYILCEYVHSFKVSARQLNGLVEPLVSIGFPMDSLNKWIVDAKSVETNAYGVEITLNKPVDFEAFQTWKTQFEPKSFQKKISSTSCIPVYGAAYRLNIEVTKMCAGLERTYRYSLGEELRMALMHLLVQVTLAGKRSMGRKERIVAARDYLIEVQLCLRVLVDLGSLPEKRYVTYIEMLADLEKQLSNWERAEDTRYDAARVPSP